MNIPKILRSGLNVIALLYIAWSLFIMGFCGFGWLAKDKTLFGVLYVACLLALCLLWPKKKLRFKAGIFLGLVHLLFLFSFLIAVTWAPHTGTPCGMEGIIIFYVDFPLTPFILPVYVLAALFRGSVLALDIANIASGALLAILGTLWFFFIPTIMAKLHGNVKRETKTS